MADRTAPPPKPKRGRRRGIPRFGPTRRALVAGVVASFLGGFAGTVLAQRFAPPLVGPVGGTVAAVVFTGVWFIARRRILGPIRRLSRGLRTVRESRGPETALLPVAAPMLGALPEECDALVAALRHARRDTRKAAQTETMLIDAERAWLASVVETLDVPVIVCSRANRILLFNRSAAELFADHERVGLGRDLEGIIAPGPLQDAFDRLIAAQDPHGVESVTCIDAGDGGPLATRIALLSDPGGAVAGYVAGYVVTFARAPDAASARAPEGATARAQEGASGRPASGPLPPRPQFYDFSLMRAHRGDTELAHRVIRTIDYVAFDCETTGLYPAQGDEIIQIGAIRIVGGRVLRAETFERLVNPGRPIPASSTKFHGLSDADVARAPAIGSVLAEFRSFVGDAVLVGHNVAFDLKFLALKETVTGVRLPNAVLDTMLVSLMLDDDEEDHSLDGLGARYGLDLSDRHMALGDARATADLLVALFDRLEAKGFDTFGAVMDASNMAAKLRYRAAVFAQAAPGRG